MRISDFWAIHVGRFPKQGPGRPRGLQRAWRKSNHGQDYHPYGRAHEVTEPEESPTAA